MNKDDIESAPNYDTHKQEARDKYKGLSVRELAEEMTKIAKIKDEVEAKLSKVNAYYDVVRLELLPSKMEDDGVESVKLEGIGRLSLTGDMYVKVTDKLGLKAWLAKMKKKDLMQETINASTLKAFLKDRMKKQQPVPDEQVVKITPFTRASITKS